MAFGRQCAEGRPRHQPARDGGYVTAERNLTVLLGGKLRAGDIYTHCFSGHRDEVVAGKLNAAMLTGRKRGIFFDIGHGGGSFYGNAAAPVMEQKFLPDSISTDLHTGSMSAGMKDRRLVAELTIRKGRLCGI
jgi:dihydroorotase